VIIVENRMKKGRATWNRMAAQRNGTISVDHKNLDAPSPLDDYIVATDGRATGISEE
jgi:hypothetical protein